MSIHTEYDLLSLLTPLLYDHTQSPPLYEGISNALGLGNCPHIADGRVIQTLNLTLNYSLKRGRYLDSPPKYPFNRF